MDELKQWLQSKGIDISNFNQLVKEDLDEQKGAVSADDSKGKLQASDLILYFSHSTDRTYDEEQIVI